jgi:hypothetical protein
MPSQPCSVCGAVLRLVETRTVWERALFGPEMAYVEEKRVCADGHTVLALRNDTQRAAPAS